MKYVILIVVLLVGLGWSLASGSITFKTDEYRCAFGKHWQPSGEKLTLWSAGRIHVSYQPVDYTCPVEQRYDPAKYKNSDGLMELRDTPAPTK